MKPNFRAKYNELRNDILNRIEKEGGKKLQKPVETSLNGMTVEKVSDNGRKVFMRSDYQILELQEVSIELLSVPDLIAILEQPEEDDRWEEGSDDEWLTRRHSMNYCRRGSDLGITDILMTDVRDRITQELGVDGNDFKITRANLMEYMISFELNAPERVHRKVETNYYFDGNWND